MKNIRKKAVRIMLLFVWTLFFLHIDTYAVSGNTTRIHFISLYGASDAILLESNGHFGMVDFGEDWDYPSGSTGSKYPYRYGITTNEGYEQQVIYYLKQLGVEKLDFYIATHAHSDHIGSGDEIIEHFPVDRLYIAEYDDSYQLAAHGKDVTDPYYYEDADEDTLWDNQYVYDRIIQAAQDHHVKIITDLDLEENAVYRRFRIGNMSISIMNYERKRDADGNIIPVANENDNSLVVRVNAYGKNALLTSDLDPVDGDTEKIAEQVKRVKIDLLKLPHHGIDYNNPSDFLTPLNPKTAVMTGPSSWFNTRMRACLPNTNVYFTMSDSAAVVADFSFYGIATEYVKTESEWGLLDGTYYYFDSNGRVTTGWGYIGNAWYYFDEKGSMQTGWQYVNGAWYYISESGAMVTGWQMIEGVWYYFNENGSMQTGWRYVNGVWYYFDLAGEMTTSWQKIDEIWYYMSESGVMQCGWQKIGGIWYFFEVSGAMDHDMWIQGVYYLKSSGAMAVSEWVGYNQYYVDERGIWAP